MSSMYHQNLNFSPARNNIPSPRLSVRANTDIESQYLADMMNERNNLQPFMQVLPICSRLLDQEILRVSGRLPNLGLNDYDRLQRGSPGPMDVMPDLAGKSVAGWSGTCWNNMQHERLSGPQSMNIDWKPPGSPSAFLVKRVLRLDIPVDRHPSFNFVGRLLGPRGNSLKRVEASTCCRVFIRGRGSIKDTVREENLRGKPGYEHLNEPLHILVEAEAADVPASIVDARLKQAKDIIEELLKPVEESQDMYKRQQLRELAMLNNIPEESPQPGGH